MYLLKKSIPNYKNIKNIIFDFGGVICDIDINKTIEKFDSFGSGKEDPVKDPEGSPSAFEKLVAKFETGHLTPAEFRESIRNYYLSRPDDRAIDDAWNALLTGIPEKRIRLLEELKKQYRLILLSNTNEIHYRSYLEDFRNKYGYKNFDEIFEKIYFSFQMKIRKPDPGVFNFVLSDLDLIPAETLFIDDMLPNVQGARSIGITGYHLKEGEDVSDLFILPQ